ncbi:hypothetical protein M0R45_037892 [Rubus argutus]|uniref:UBC core domain-containing protein n=1 Tax=Rubus argutus TaxID=59490 RepID=A0AAW1W3G7_RUBAR
MSDSGISAFPEKDTIMCWKGRITGGQGSDESNKWSSAYDVRTVLLSTKSLLDDPNLSTPVNFKAATLWSNQKEYRKTAEKLYRPIRYGSEKGTIDRFGGQLWEMGSDGLGRPTSYVKRNVARE